MRRRTLSTVGLALSAAAFLSFVGCPGDASAAAACHPIEVEGAKIRVAVVGATCDVGREVAAGYFQRSLNEDHFDWKTRNGAIYYDVEGFRCATGLAGSQAFCRHHDDWVYASSRPEDHPANFDKPAPTGSSCASVNTSLITSREVETSPGFGCSGARKVIKKYFRLVIDTAQTEGGCAQKRYSSGCGVGDCRCRATYFAATRELHSVCRGPKGTVRFEEIDRAPNA